MDMIFSLITSLLICCAGVACGQSFCTKKADGLYSYGCRSYIRCVKGIGTINDCEYGKVFNWKIKPAQCVPRAEAPHPCNFTTDCTGIPDGKYPVPPDCIAFYTCFKGIFYGVNPCNNPPDDDTLVYNSTSEACDWKNNVKKPCGTKV